MPELPDITLYMEALERRIAGARLNAIRLGSPFLLRTVSPPMNGAVGRDVVGLRRVGKRICIGTSGGTWLVLHLMIAGRLHWKTNPGKPKPVKVDGRRNLAAFDFAGGTLLLTEAGTQKRASLHIVAGEEGLAALDPGGIDVFTATAEQFAARLTGANHTLKRALTDPRIFDGIGNAYSDEILHRARLSPVTLTQKMTPDAIERLRVAATEVLCEWIERLRRECGDGFPESVTAFRPEMAAHGRFGLPCPACGEKIQRIRYANNETNYCPQCQTSGRLLADRGLSRLLGADWPRTLEELEGLARR